MNHSITFAGKCPRCGFRGPAVPDWIWSLHFVAKHKRPVFDGLIEDQKWKDDPELVEWLSKEWVEMRSNGFMITASGLDFLRSLGICV